MHRNAVSLPDLEQRYDLDVGGMERTKIPYSLIG